MANNLVYALLLLPMILLVSIAVFNSFHSVIPSNFEASVVNESLGTGEDTYYTAYPAKVDSATVYNGTTTCPVAVCTVDYKEGLHVAEVVAGAGAGATAIKISYTAYSHGGYTEYVQTYEQTYSGYSLGSMLPFVLIAMTMVGIIVATFVFKS